jgi:integrase
MVKPKEKPKKWLWSDNGKRWYFRRNGQYVRILGEYGSQEFDLEYWAIRGGKAAGSRKTWAALIANYKTSERWRHLSGVTRTDYQRVLDYMLEKNAQKEVPKLKRSDVLAAMEANRSRVRFANYIPQVLSILCEHAIDLGWLTANPAKGARRFKTPPEKQRIHEPWTDAAVSHWRANAAPIPRLIFEVAVGSVQRPADWTRFRWGDYDGDSLQVVQGKTGKALHLPCTDALRTALDAARPDPCDARTAILLNHYGQTLNYRAMAAIMLKERRRLGLEAYDLHALRYRGVMELAWAGCDDDEIAAFSGHASKDMIRKYAGRARQVTQARSARDKRAGTDTAQKEI